MSKYISLLFFSFCLLACQKQTKLFELLNPKNTGVQFSNRITEYDSLNIFNTEFIYNGGGVGIGDLNGDGMADLFFTGNQVANELYLNKGKLQFDKVTHAAGLDKPTNQWSSGINLIDLNTDGKLDIYVCNTLHRDPRLRANSLYINQGNDSNHIPQFKEMAGAYGIADTSHSSNAQFFDFDNDGDLDLFIAVNFMDTGYPNRYLPRSTDGSSPNRDILYRNDWQPEAKHPVFTDVTLQAGIKMDGYSHSSLIGDFNEDGLLDIYVANDYVSNDLLFINQGDGTFKNEIDGIFKHQSASAMGSDLADINNDGRLDLFTTEMMPSYNKRKKLFLNANNYNTYINNETYGYEYQYARNTLQLHQGFDPLTGLPVFSDVAFIAGTQETDWSWATLLADYDNDGLCDLFIANGFPRDVTDHDFGAYRSTVSYLVPPLELQASVPQVRAPKFAFKNLGDLRFQDVSKTWGVDVPGFSNGAAYGDLDNDGDLDLVVNNINDSAFIFRNNLMEKKMPASNYIRFVLPNNSFGTSVCLYADSLVQKRQLLSGRGYLSVGEPALHFGLGRINKIDSAIITWPGHVPTVLKDLAANQVVQVDPATSRKVKTTYQKVKTFGKLLAHLDPHPLGLSYMQRDSDFVDFNFQRTLPHKYSQYGPSLAVGDVNGDGREDVYISGSAFYDGRWFIQQPKGIFSQKSAWFKQDPQKKEEELGTLLFDADNDGDNDLYIVRGGNQAAPQSPLYQDVLCVNDGKGNFSVHPGSLPLETACGQAVKAADYDRDGDLDLFVAGRVSAFAYPKPERSFILRNDTREKDKPVFTNVTAEICPDLELIGLVGDALWTDFNNDFQPDLLLAGEWMPLTLFENNQGRFKNVTSATGIQDRIGWWTSLVAADFDKDGDMDYVGGNLGENTYFKCNAQEPLRIYAKDFDENGLYDPFITCYWPDSLGTRKEYIYHTRDDVLKQLIKIKAKFPTYGTFGEATLQDIFSPDDLKGAQILQANWMQTSFIKNLGTGKFSIHPLPVQAQLAPIYGMLAMDVDQDNWTDLIMVGNDFGMELLQGRADGFNGLVLKNHGNGMFKTLNNDIMDFFVPGDARALVSVVVAENQQLVLAAQNRQEIKVFGLGKTPIRLPPSSDATKALATFADGSRQLFELYWGNSFLSQSGRGLSLPGQASTIVWFDFRGKQLKPQ